MPKSQKLNRLNFSYFFTTSFLSLLAVFVFLVIPLLSYQPSSVKKTPQQLPVTPPEYTLEPHPQADIEMVVSDPNIGYGINVLLKDANDNVVIDQNNNFYYQWSIADSSITKIEDKGFDVNCPFNINSPCPNLHADIIGLKAGKTVITVKAYKTGGTESIANTSFNLTVLSRHALINYKVKFKGIDKKPSNTADQIIRVKGYNLVNQEVPGHCREFTFGAGPGAIVDNNGIYTGYVNLDDCYLNHSGYKLCFKGPKHLQSCFKDITFKRDQVLDLTSKPLEPGDLPLPQNGKVDQNDFNYLWNNRGSTDQNVLKIGDLNLDGTINMGDINLLLQTLSSKSDEEGW